MTVTASLWDSSTLFFPPTSAVEKLEKLLSPQWASRLLTTGSAAVLCRPVQLYEIRRSAFSFQILVCDRMSYQSPAAAAVAAAAAVSGVQ